MKLKRDLLFRCYSVLEDIKTGSNKLQFQYKIVRNLKRMSDEVEFIKTTAKPTDKFREYEQKRLEIIEQAAQRDDAGNIIWAVENSVPKFTDQAAVEADIKSLIDSNKDVLEEQMDRESQLKKFLEEEVELELYKFKLSELPQEIRNDQMEVLIDLVEE